MRCIQAILKCIFIIIFICSSEDRNVRIDKTKKIRSEDKKAAKPEEESKGIVRKLFYFKYKKYLYIFSFL